MTDISKQIIEKMQASFPHRYNVYDKKTILYALLSVFGERYGNRTEIIDRLYAMIGIDSTYDEDLEHRWGSLLGVYRQSNESFDNYRNRLLIVYSSLAGGTAEAIKYAIASVIGVATDEDIINSYIKVYDAWEYPYNTGDDIDRSYGNIICTIDTQVSGDIIEYDKVLDAINTTKASGINPYLLLLYIYSDIATSSYDEHIYDKLIDGVFDESTLKPSDGETINITNIYNDEDNISRTTLTVWSSIGTNTSNAVLNDGFVTNMLMETDEHVDNIIYVSAVLGLVKLGYATLGAGAILGADAVLGSTLLGVSKIK